MIARLMKLIIIMGVGKKMVDSMGHFKQLLINPSIVKMEHKDKSSRIKL